MGGSNNKDSKIVFRFSLRSSDNKLHGGFIWSVFLLVSIFIVCHCVHGSRRSNLTFRVKWDHTEWESLWPTCSDEWETETGQQAQKGTRRCYTQKIWKGKVLEDLIVLVSKSASAPATTQTVNTVLLHVCRKLIELVSFTDLKDLMRFS